MRCNSSAIPRTLQSKPKEDTREDGGEQANDNDGNGHPRITGLIEVFRRGTFLVGAKFTYMPISKVTAV